MKAILDPILGLFRNHKLKILTVVCAFLFFLVTLFPFRDLGDLITGQISEATQNQVYLDFKDLGISVFPQPGLTMQNVTIDNPMFPTLSANSLFVSPSILGLITFKPGVKVDAEGLMGGDVHLTTRGGESTKAGPRKQHIELAIEKMNLKNFSQFLNQILEHPVNLSGGVTSQLEVTVDPSFNDQPEGSLGVSAQGLKWTDASISTDLGAFPLPDLSFKGLDVSTELKKGHLTISKGQFGAAGDDLVAKVTGEVDVKVGPGLRGPQLMPGAYDLNVSLQVKPSMAAKLALPLNFIDTYKRAGPEGTTLYSFRISAASTASQPHMAPSAQ